MGHQVSSNQFNKFNCRAPATKTAQTANLVWQEITTTTEPASTAKEDRPRGTAFTDESSSETSQADAKSSSDALSGGTAAGIAVGEAEQGTGGRPPRSR